MERALEYCTYVLISLTDRKLYIGYTTNLDRRLQEHNSGRVISTANRRPLKLIFCEYYFSDKDAKRREMLSRTQSSRRSLVTGKKSNAVSAKKGHFLARKVTSKQALNEQHHAVTFPKNAARS